MTPPRDSLSLCLCTPALALRAAVFTLPWLLHLFAADALLSALLPVSAVFPNLAYNLSSRIAESVWRGIQLIFTRINGANIVVSREADRLPRGESAIVLSNHVDWTDFYLIQHLAIQCGMLGRCRYFAKRQLKWVPFLGWGLWAMGMPLVSRKWMTDRKEMDRVFYHITRQQWPVWLISFSEATRYSASKRKAAEDWCLNNNKALGAHLLYPRTKGFVATVQKLRKTPHVKAVYDFTIAYAQDDKLFQVPPSFWQSLSWPNLAQKWRLFVHVDRHELEQLPLDDEALATWLEARWVEKGERLERLRQLLLEHRGWDRDSGAVDKSI
ncbi:uncharacterized protein MYCFIDRAFT_184949 [Pseudocercospora fijiensis CIRAD86]|uniref:Phospholipid/glycerol acyltransferase domain-containing protein n=1 Tax=Pseudocercospora fijiensis (strain CIRAD86) TaxID=383855 RepID=N1Q6R2_PSEFD|nr:uncharacterized protein MYCFIDRAFT_184949 [Pseudocercospora fijiensis CIRAD86]EME88185.1 hypothetical protein MYCFIDRAFT_184949 [Pseudocercospora fijiensis CIRAD86]